MWAFSNNMNNQSSDTMPPTGVKSSAANSDNSPPLKCDAYWRRPELVSEFKTFWAEIDSTAAAEEAQAAAAAAQVAEARAKAEEYGFSYPVDATLGVSFEEALAWTVGCTGPHRRGYRDVDKFRAWLGRAEYPYLDTGRITRKGFDLVLQGERAQRRNYQTNWKRTFRDAHLEEQTPINHCLECGENLRRPNARYCSTKCKQVAYRKRHRYG
jgi:hypothetical protein